MSSTIARSRSGEMSRFSVAFFSREELLRVEVSRRPSFL